MVQVPEDAEVDADTLVIGASAAGLAVAAGLEQAGVGVIVLERESVVGSSWRRHYDRLHLHTSRGLSGLPYLPMPKSYPRYPSRDQVVEYLESYASHFGIEPVFGEQVEAIERSNGRWETRSSDRVWTSRRVVVATGYARVPVVPEWPGNDVFEGPVLHSSEYKNGDTFRGQRVLVVGFGNSAGEIALDLVERGAEPTLSVRGPVNVVPRDLIGIPILAWGIVLNLLPAKLADLLSKPLLRLSVGDIRDAGLEKLPYGPIEQIREHDHIPLLDIGTLRAIRSGEISVRPAIEQLTPDSVVFADGRDEEFDAVVVATGYRPQLADFLLETEGVLNADGLPLVSGTETGSPGLYLCGFYVSPTGMLREISIEAKRIVSQIEATVT